MAELPAFPDAISEEIWNAKYRFRPVADESGVAIAAPDASLDDTFWRVARAAAGLRFARRR